VSRWPEDMTWNPYEDGLFATYIAYGRENQVSIINMIV
jgi:hypothetical protein